MNHIIDESSIDHILSLAHSHVHNYVIPGLTSSLIGERSPHGSVRMFECSRDHQEVITPHSHRFDFTSIVLRGSVVNRIWEPMEGGDTYQTVHLDYSGEIGRHSKRLGPVLEWGFKDREYVKGQAYSMQADEVHSIWFSRGAVVLLFEGPTIRKASVCIEPFINGQLVETMTVQPWMFSQKGGTDQPNPQPSGD